MAGFTQEHKRIVEYVKPQGVDVTRTTKGLLFRFPNGETNMLHYTESDWRATRNFRANLRRNGIEYPGDYSDKKHKKPPYKDSIEKVKEALKDFDPNTVTTVQLASKLGNMGSSTITHVMLHLGYWHDYRPSKSKKSFVWHPPVDPKEIIEPLEDMENLVEHPDDSNDYRTTVTAKELSQIYAEKQHSDSTDSIPTDPAWTVQLDLIDGNITIDMLRMFYMAAGLNVEMRVWR